MLIVEDGTVVIGAECYNTLATADEYHLKRNNTVWAGLTDIEKEAAIRKASDYILQTYRNRWDGYRVVYDQPLDWPRSLVKRDLTTDTEFVDNALVITSDRYYPPDFIPRELLYAEAELALRSVTEDLNIETERLTTEERVGSIAVRYDKSARDKRVFPMVEGFLRPFFRAGGQSRLVRG